MYDIKPQILEVLEAIPDSRVFISYPEGFEELPLISFYELSNREIFNGTDCEELSDISIQIDIYGETVAEVDNLAFLVDNKMKSIGFRRDFAGDLYDEETGLRHKIMRYKGIVDNETKYVYQ